MSKPLPTPWNPESLKSNFEVQQDLGPRTPSEILAAQNENAQREISMKMYRVYDIQFGPPSDLRMIKAGSPLVAMALYMSGRDFIMKEIGDTGRAVACYKDADGQPNMIPDDDWQFQCELVNPGEPKDCWKGCAPVLRGLLDRDADRTNTFYDSLTHDERVALKIVVDTLGKD